MLSQFLCIVGFLCLAAKHVKNKNSLCFTILLLLINSAINLILQRKRGHRSAWGHATFPGNGEDKMQVYVL